MSTIIDSRPDIGINLQPFRHRVIDDWTDPELVRAAEAEWPDERWPFTTRNERRPLSEVIENYNELRPYTLCSPAGSRLTWTSIRRSMSDSKQQTSK